MLYTLYYCFRYFALLTLPLREGYSKWFGKLSVRVSDPAVPQKLDTPDIHTWHVYTPPK